MAKDEAPIALSAPPVCGPPPPQDRPPLPEIPGSVAEADPFENANLAQVLYLKGLSLMDSPSAKISYQAWRTMLEVTGRIKSSGADSGRPPTNILNQLFLPPPAKPGDKPQANPLLESFRLLAESLKR